MHGESMNKYTFNWNITPDREAEYALKVPPFEVVARGNMLTLTATADAADEQRLLEQADEVTHNLARGLSLEHGERFEVTFGSHEVDGKVFIRAAAAGSSVMAGLDLELRDAAVPVKAYRLWEKNRKLKRAWKRQQNPHNSRTI